MEKYLNLNKPAPVRLDTLRTLAKATKRATWRDARGATFASQEPFFNPGVDSVGGVRGDVPVIVAFENPDCYGWRMQYADEVEHSAIDHTGWFQDEQGERATIRGLIIRLPHDRFLAGYVNNENGEYVIFREIFTRARDAAQYGDKQAERIADDEREYSRRYTEVVDMRDRLDDIKTRLAELQVLIDNGNFPNASGEAARLTDEAAWITGKLNDEYSDIEI